MMGKKINFKGMNHATETMQQLHRHGVMRQQLKDKQQIERLAAALDNQIAVKRNTNFTDRCSLNSSVNRNKNNFTQDYFNSAIESRNATSFIQAEKAKQWDLQQYRRQL